jgi:hypothetical protein
MLPVHVCPRYHSDDHRSERIYKHRWKQCNLTVGPAVPWMREVVFRITLLQLRMHQMHKQLKPIYTASVCF